MCTLMFFTGIGKFPGMPYKFQLKENEKPTRHAPRKVPIHLQDAFHKEIHNLEKLGILEETKDVTEWVNSFVIMEKKTPDVSNSQSDRKLQICLDPRDLNEALEREPYYTQSIEEIMTRFHGMTRFYNCRLQQRILDGGAQSRISKVHYNGIRHW